jgi:hypothetical protein
MAVPYPEPLDAWALIGATGSFIEAAPIVGAAYERSPSTPLAATDLALCRGEHRGKARALPASRDPIKPTAQLGGEFRERAHR